MPKLRPLSQTKFINDANLVSYWPLDGNSNDSKGSNNGTDTAITYNASYAVQSNFGQGASFNGSSSKIDLPNLGVSGSSARTISGWFYVPSISASMYLYCSGKGSDNTNFSLSVTNAVNNSQLYLYCNNNDYYTGVNTVPLNQWFHMTLVYDGGTLSTSTVHFYINGVSLSSTKAGTGNAAANTTNSDYSIGYYRIGNSNFFNGYSDDVAIFNRALSASEVNELYQGMTLGEYLGSGSSTTKLLLHLNGNSTDSSGNGNNGTDSNITYVDGKFGKCASFNGSSSKITINNGFSTIKGDDTHTISLWVKCNDFTNSPVILASRSGDYDIFFFELGTNTLYWGYRSASGVNYRTYTISTNSGWNLYTLVKTGATTGDVYINGVLQSNYTGSINAISSTDNGDLVFGVYTGDTLWLNGLIDETIIENRAWSSEEVKKYYTNSLGRFATL